MPSEKYTERILRFIGARGYQPQRLHELSRAMGIGEEERGDFHAACKALMRSGRIVLGSESALLLPAPPGKIVGTFRANPRGFGFVIPDTPNSHGDLFIPARKSADALTGDTVVARVLKRGKRGGKMLYEGRIVSIVKRGRSRFVGQLRGELGRWFVVPDGRTLNVPIFVGDPGAKRAKTGDQVVVEIVQYPGPDVEARGTIVKVLGRSGRPDVDTLSIIEQHQLPGDFSKKVLAEARAAAVAYDPRQIAEDREDFRKLTIITIDPTDARDFDDAISLTRLRDGSYELGVHIADVAHFIPEGEALDLEARARATSVYLPGVVIPMLPEVLSNEVCSLQERQTRLTKSTIITYDRQGVVKKARVVNSVIRSSKRLTYDRASAILEGRPGRTSADMVMLLKEMQRLAKLIRKRRIKEGMLELDLPAIELVYDEDGSVVDVVPEDTSFSHKIIEMFMVEANEAVARLLAKRKVPFLSRVHDSPRDLASGNLNRFLSALGHQLPDGADRFDLQELLDGVRGKDGAFAVHLAVLRSMQQAEYAPLDVGHYALASRYYCHFTSPIRRYPDLTIHRLINRYVAGELDTPEGVANAPSEQELVSLGSECSTSEREAEAAERELKLVLVLRLLQEQLGSVMQGIVTGVANVGVFVQLEKYLVDGRLRFEDLADDWWEVEVERGRVVGERSGRTITVGDRLEVSIARVDVPARELRLALAGPLPETTRSQRRKPSRQKTTPRRDKPTRRPAKRGPRTATATRKTATKSIGKTSTKPTRRTTAKSAGKTSTKPTRKTSVRSTKRKKSVSRKRPRR